MTYVMNTADVLPLAERVATAEKEAGPSFWQRVYNAMIESRSRSALRDLRLHAPNLVREAELVMGGFPQTTLKNDADLPFNR